MFQRVTEYDFRDAFLSSDTYKHNFSYEGLTVLFDYFEQLEDVGGASIEFDMIAICCEYSEDHWQDIADNYNIELLEEDDEDEQLATVIEYLEAHTTFVSQLHNGNLIYASF